MTAPGTSFSGPVLSGPRASTDSVSGNGANQGYALLSQVVTLTQNGTAAVSVTAYVPPHSQIVDFKPDSSVLWNSATTAILSIGTTAGASTYLGSLNLTTALATSARLSPSFTTTQMLALQDTGTTEAVVFTVTPTGATSAGTTFVTMLYRQTLNWQ